jgi:hypothetical protein
LKINDEIVKNMRFHRKQKKVEPLVQPSPEKKKQAKVACTHIG